MSPSILVGVAVVLSAVSWMLCRMAVTTVIHPNQQLFPTGTVCTVVKETNLSPMLRSPGRRPGSIAAEPTVAADGSLTVEGLEAGAQYSVWASVGGNDSRVRFMARPVPVHRRLPVLP
jgi:hypothetical protein